MPSKRGINAFSMWETVSKPLENRLATEKIHSVKKKHLTTFLFHDKITIVSLKEI